MAKHRAPRVVHAKKAIGTAVLAGGMLLAGPAGMAHAITGHSNAAAPTPKPAAMIAQRGLAADIAAYHNTVNQATANLVKNQSPGSVAKSVAAITSANQTLARDIVRDATPQPTRNKTAANAK
jgi:hypothetical protein